MVSLQKSISTAGQHIENTRKKPKKATISSTLLIIWRYQRYCCASGIFTFVLWVTWNNAYSPFNNGCSLNYLKFIIRNPRYRVKHKGWDFRYNFTELISVCLLVFMIPWNYFNLFLSLSHHQLIKPRDHLI